MVIKLPPIKLIETYLHKEDQKARLVSMYELASSLLRKQEVAAKKAEGPKAGHALYPHLRPMYRTVHRTKPREMVLRAIRWVNPERMFPLMSWDKKKMDSLSREEFEAAFAELAKIRREAHVIANRYDQMINAIDAGQLPYHIPYANINYMSLAEHRERATRLGAGAEEWGHEIDVKAEEWKEQFQKTGRWKEAETTRTHQGKKKTVEGTLTLDVIDSLWEDGAPPFMRTRGKAGRWKDERLMRARRQNVTRFEVKAKVTDADGNDIDLDFQIHAENEDQAKRMVTESAKRAGQSNVQKVDITSVTKLKKIKLPSRAKVWQREFVTVPDVEQRPGEEVRVPKGNLAGQMRFPSRKPAWMDEKKWKALIKGQKGKFGPAGNHVDMTSAPLDFYDTNIEVALRREQRWTQRGLAPHKGAASRITGGHEEEERQLGPGLPPLTPRPPARETPEQKAAREAREQQWAQQRQAKQQQAQQAAAAPDAGHAKGNALLKNQRLEKAIERAIPEINDFIVIDAPDGFDPATHFTADNIKEAKLTKGGVLNTGATFVVTDNAGQRWLLKAANEGVEELACVAIDRALDLNVCPRIILANNVAAAAWSGSSGASTALVRERFEHGDGHIGEWINDESKMMDDMTFDELQSTVATPEQRARWYGVALVDAISGNGDSWGNNLIFKPGVGVFSIDNGLAFGQGLRLMKGATNFGDSFPPGRGHIRGKTAGILRGSFEAEGFDRDEMEQELNTWFDDTWDADALQKVSEALDVDAPGGGWDTLRDVPKLRKDFVDKMLEWFYDSSPSRGGGWASWKQNGIPNR